VKILVTGGAGFVGSVCTYELVREGHFVVVVDDLSAGRLEAVPPEAQFYRCDIGDTSAIEAVLREHCFDTVFHFAARALIPESVSNPGIFFEQNVASGIAFLEAIRRSGIRKFVFSSSAAVYGTPAKIPILEEDPKNPVNSYGETKLMFERILEWYTSAYQWTAVSFRYFNACGAAGGIGEDHRPETHIIPLLLQTAAGQRPYFEIYGCDYPTPDGSCLRDYVHVRDIAAAHLGALTVSGGAFAYNIGTGNSHSVLDVCRSVEEVTGSKVAVRKRARRPGDPAILCASPAKLQKDLGWVPRHSELRNIIASAWEWKRLHPGGYDQVGRDLAASRR